MVTKLFPRYHRGDIAFTDIKEAADRMYYNEIDALLDDIEKIFWELGFSKRDIGRYTNYVLGNTFCIPVYVDKLGFIIEYAESEEEALNNMHGDGDSYPFDFGCAAILAGVYADIVRDVPELCDNMNDQLVSGGFTIEHYNDRFYYIKDGIYCVPQHKPGRTKLFITYAESIDAAENDVNDFEQ